MLVSHFTLLHTTMVNTAFYYWAYKSETLIFWQTLNIHIYKWLVSSEKYFILNISEFYHCAAYHLMGEKHNRSLLPWFCVCVCVWKKWGGDLSLFCHLLSFVQLRHEEANFHVNIFFFLVQSMIVTIRKVMVLLFFLITFSGILDYGNKH